MLKWLLLESTKLEQEVKLFALHLQQLLLDEDPELETSLGLMDERSENQDKYTRSIATAFIFIERRKNNKYSVELTAIDKFEGIRVILHYISGYSYIDGPLTGSLWKTPTPATAREIITKLG